MHSVLRSAAIPISLLLLTACPPAGPAPLTDADRAAIQAVGDTFAARLTAGDIDGIVQLYTDNAAVMAPDAPPVRGREAIKAFVSAFPRAKTFTFVEDTVVGFGDRAYVRGHFVLTFADTAMGSVAGKYIEIRRKQADGSWPMEIDMWSPNAPAPAPAPARH